VTERGLAIALVCAFAAPVSAQEVKPEPLTLEQAIARALARNPDVLSAAAEVRRAEGLVMQVRAGSLPIIAPGADYKHTSFSIAFMGVSAGNADQLTAAFPLSLQLSPQRWAAWAHQVDNRHVSELGVGTVRRQVAIAVANAYLTVIVQKRRLEVTQLSRDNTRAHADYTQKQLAGGTASKLDAVRAGQQFHTAEAQVEASTIAVARAQEALGVLVAGDRPIDASEAPRFPMPGPEDRPERRADILQQKMQQTAFRHQVRDDYTDYLPYLTAAFAGLFAQPVTVFQPEWSWQATVSLVVPLYDGGARYGLARQRQAALDQSTDALDGQLRAAHADVRFGYLEVAHADTRQRETREAASLAHQALEIATLRYENGATDNLAVVDAQQAALIADLTATLAEDDAQTARLNLLAATGAFP
jgi:outer membrane protein TolC